MDKHFGVGQCNDCCMEKCRHWNGDKNDEKSVCRNKSGEKSGEKGNKSGEKSREKGNKSGKKSGGKRGRGRRSIDELTEIPMMASMSRGERYRRHAGGENRGKKIKGAKALGFISAAVCGKEETGKQKGKCHCVKSKSRWVAQK